jgi:hypothetical protein
MLGSVITVAQAACFAVAAAVDHGRAVPFMVDVGARVSLCQNTPSGAQRCRCGLSGNES